MAWSLINHAAAIGSGGGETTTGVDTTGANLLIAVCSGITGNVSPTDSKSNTWTRFINDQNLSSSNKIEMWYALPSASQVGSSHTFSNSDSTSSIAVQAWSGSRGFTPVDQSNHAASGTTAGSITPTVGNCLVVGGATTGSGGDPSALVGYTITDHIANNGSAFGIGMGYLVQTAPVATNPAWTLGGGDPAMGIASFFPKVPSMFAVF